MTPSRAAAILRSADQGDIVAQHRLFEDMLDRDAMDIVMVDLCWTGGLTEGRKIAAMAEAGVPYVSLYTRTDFMTEEQPA